jgi:ABC-type glutathione transport system ATPase component
VRRADRIIVIENGTIAETGNHDSLLQLNGTYRRLYDLQFVDADAPLVAAAAQSMQSISPQLSS